MESIKSVNEPGSIRVRFIALMFWFTGILISFSVLTFNLSVAMTYIAACAVQICLWTAHIKMMVFFVRRWSLKRTSAKLFTMSSLIFTLVQITSYASMYIRLGLNQTDLNLSDYIYFSAITWTTVGYGDLAPSADARIMTAMEAVTGSMFMGVFIALLGSLLWSGLQRDLANESAELAEWRAKRRLEDQNKSLNEQDIDSHFEEHYRKDDEKLNKKAKRSKTSNTK